MFTCQFVTGIGIPVDLDLETVTIGYVFKADFYLPDNVTYLTNFIQDQFDVSPHPINTFKRKRRAVDETAEQSQPLRDVQKGFDSNLNERYETYNVDAEVIESGTESDEKMEQNRIDAISGDAGDFYEDDPMALKKPQNIKTSRWTLYKGMAFMAERFESFKYSLYYRLI